MTTWRRATLFYVWQLLFLKTDSPFELANLYCFIVSTIASWSSSRFNLGGFEIYFSIIYSGLRIVRLGVTRHLHSFTLRHLAECWRGGRSVLFRWSLWLGPPFFCIILASYFLKPRFSDFVWGQRVSPKCIFFPSHLPLIPLVWTTFRGFLGFPSIVFRGDPLTSHKIVHKHLFKRLRFSKLLISFIAASLISHKFRTLSEILIIYYCVLNFIVL